MSFLHRILKTDTFCEGVFHHSIECAVSQLTYDIYPFLVYLLLLQLWLHQKFKYVSKLLFMPHDRLKARTKCIFNIKHDFFPQYETHTQQAILWFCPVWLVIGVFSSSSNFPFRLWTRMFSTLSSCPNKKVDTFEIPVEYMVLYILFLQKCRRAPRIPFPYTSISAI